VRRLLTLAGMVVAGWLLGSTGHAHAGTLPHPAAVVRGVARAVPVVRISGGPHGAPALNAHGTPALSAHGTPAPNAHGMLVLKAHGDPALKGLKAVKGAPVLTALANAAPTLTRGAALGATPALSAALTRNAPVRLVSALPLGRHFGLNGGPTGRFGGLSPRRALATTHNPGHTHRRVSAERLPKVPRVPWEPGQVPHQQPQAAGVPGAPVVGYIASLDPVRPRGFRSSVAHASVTPDLHPVTDDPFFSPD
jgi:hypothetical protein